MQRLTHKPSPRGVSFAAPGSLEGLWKRNRKHMKKRNIYSPWNRAIFLQKQTSMGFLG